MADLVGRTDELELIEALLAGRSQTGRSMLLRGDPGIGKTALLCAATARAEAAGMRVLRASGVESEAEIDFSGLHQLLYPVRECAERLDAGHRAALDQIFGVVPRPSLEPLVISTAVLALLAEVAAERPLLLLVDDVPWIDRASATVLGFVARRIADTPIAFLAAARTGGGGFFDQVGLPEGEIGPLATRPASALLDAQWPGLAPTVRRRLLDEAAGNPLALRELPGLLTDRQRSGQDPLPASLPLSGRLEAAFTAGVRALPASTRQLLLLAALEPDTSLATIRAAARAAQHNAAIDDLEPARQAGLIRPDPREGWISFRHPLIRSAVVQASSPGEHRFAHRALAAKLVREAQSESA